MAIGKVNVFLYFGSNFNYMNIPYDTDMIGQSSTRILNKPGQIVWQADWLTGLRLDVVDYNDIMGVQFVKITDVGTEDKYDNWYEVIGARQVNRRTVELTLQYDVLLSINVKNITGITGRISRWTVDNDDSDFGYTMSSEPLNITEPYVYNYEQFSQVAMSNSPTKLVGSAMDLNVPPEVIQYENQSSENSQIYYPKTELSTPTQFVTKMPNADKFDDGLGYFNWEDATVKDNYNAAVGLAYDIAVNPYILPVSSIIEITWDGNRVKQIIGNYSDWTFNDGKLIKDGEYKNKKTKEIGIFFTLYNPYTGDSVTVNNYELRDAKIRIYVNPYSNGAFYSKFRTYMKSTDYELSGLVKSCGWRKLTLSSNVSSGEAIARYSNDYYKQVNSEYLTAANINAVTSGVDMLLAFGHTVMTTGLLMYSGLSGLLTTESNLSIAGTMGEKAASHLSSAVSNFSNAMAARNIYKAESSKLEVEGTLISSRPPAVKFANVDVYGDYSYTFFVRTSSISDNDRKKADEFFTAYGYNVEGKFLNNPSQLNCRQLFTYIKADDVFITSINDITEFKRYKDEQSTADIKDRFSNGVRIWQTNPNYDWANVNNGVK